MVVMAPKDENELQHMLKTAVAHDGPIAVRYPRGNGVGAVLEEVPHVLPIGKGEILTEGQDVAILAIGATVKPALDAEQILTDQGLSATVINARFVKPLDSQLITGIARKMKHIVTVEENVLQGGFGSSVLECLADEGITENHVLRLGIRDRFVEHGSQKVLREEYGLDARGIARAVADVVEPKQLATVRG